MKRNKDLIEKVINIIIIKNKDNSISPINLKRTNKNPRQDKEVAS